MWKIYFNFLKQNCIFFCIKLNKFIKLKNLRSTTAQKFQVYRLYIRRIVDLFFHSRMLRKLGPSILLEYSLSTENCRAGFY